jgi:phosphoserine phosphatase
MVSNENRGSRACVTDWDGTLRPGFMVADWLLFLSKEFSIATFYHDSLVKLASGYRSKEISYERFAREAVAIYGQALRGLRCKDVDDASEAFVKGDIGNLFPFTIDLLNKISEAGFSIHVLSGGPLRPISAYARQLPISGIFAVDGKCELNGVFSGAVVKNYALRQNKGDAVSFLRSAGYEICLAFGDTESDAPLLEAADHSFLLDEADTKPVISTYYRVTPETILGKVAEVVLKSEAFGESDNV